MTKIYKAFAPGKIILTGEHAAVHGFPATVASLSRGITVTVAPIEKQDPKSQQLQDTPFIKNILDIARKKFLINVEDIHLSMHSDIPIGSSLGSSAATASATFQAIAKYTDTTISKEKLFALVQESEKFAHGNPSGLDATAVVYEGILRFQKKDGQFNFSNIQTEALTNKHFFLIQSGVPKETTKDMIEKVRVLIEKDSSKRRILEDIGQLSVNFYESLEQGIFNPEIFTKNEELLEKLEVVGSIAKAMIKKIETIKGYAKISGGGGFSSGSGMLLTYHPDSELFEKYMKDQSWQYVKTELGTQ